MPASDVLASVLETRLAPPAYAWIHGVLDATYAPFDARAFRAEWARVGRRTGSAVVELTLDEAAAVRQEGDTPPVGWGLDEVARAALLLRALAVSDADTHVPLVYGLYQRGTIRERQAVLRVLAWLPDPARFVDLAAEASRTHVTSVFEALVLANPYPARWFVRPLFDQLVQKALSLRMPPERIVGLADRVASGPAPRISATAPVARHPAHPALRALIAP
jgi:hypothetical protein